MNGDPKRACLSVYYRVKVPRMMMMVVMMMLRLAWIIVPHLIGLFEVVKGVVVSG